MDQYKPDVNNERSDDKQETIVRQEQKSESTKKVLFCTSTILVSLKTEDIKYLITTNVASKQAS